MKLAMINISLRPGGARRQLPVGFAYILTALKKNGIEFDLIDMDILNMSLGELRGILEKEAYDALGLGCIVTGLKKVVEIADLAKTINPKTIIFAGNSVATSIPELLLRKTRVDLAVIGEGDLTVVELVEALRENREVEGIPGLALKKNGGVHFTPERKIVARLDDLGYPDWNLFDLGRYSQYDEVNFNKFYSHNTTSFPISTARGCPYNCSFCYHVFKGRPYRRYSEKSIVNEIKRLNREYGCTYFSFWDELSFPDTKTIESFLAEITKLDFDLIWRGPCRAGLFKSRDLPLVREMKRLGCESLTFSLENADPEILKAMNKKITVESFVEQARVLQEGGIIPLTSVIFGYPQETVASIRRTIEVCEECNIYPSVGFLLPLPKTPIYEWALSNGKLGDEFEYLMRLGDRQDFHINITNMSDELLIGTVKQELEQLALRQGFKFENPMKTVTYKSPLVTGQAPAGENPLARLA